MIDPHVFQLQKFVVCYSTHKYILSVTENRLIHKYMCWWMMTWRIMDIDMTYSRL
jgi:hypothetical protein